MGALPPGRRGGEGILIDLCRVWGKTRDEVRIFRPAHPTAQHRS